MPKLTSSPIIFGGESVVCAPKGATESFEFCLSSDNTLPLNKEPEAGSLSGSPVKRRGTSAFTPPMSTKNPKG